MLFPISALKEHGLEAGNIDYVIGTHGHSDHIGNLNLFPVATFIVCYDICKGDEYFDNKFAEVGHDLWCCLFGKVQ